MTMKKIGISVLASALMTTGAMASSPAKATVTSSASTIASELLVGQDYNATASMDLNTTYQPSLNAGVNDGKLLVTFQGGRIQALGNTNAIVINKTQGKIVGINPQLSGQDNQKLTFDINDSINDYDTLFLADQDTDGNYSTHDDNLTLTLDMLQGNEKVTMNYALLDNVDKTLDTKPAGTVQSTAKQWNVTIANATDKFDAQIDASKAFLKFVANATTTTGTTADDGIITVTENKVDIGTGTLSLQIDTGADKNVSSFAVATDNTGSVTNVGSLAESFDGTNYTAERNITVGETGGANTSTYDLTYTVGTAGLKAIDETNFTAAVKATSTVNNTHLNTQYLATGTDFGNWTIYGYQAQIPKVTYETEAGAGNNIDTKISFTNRSSLTAGVYMTIYAEDGSKCSYSDVNALTPDNSKEYVFSNVLATCPAGYPDHGSFSVEVSIPTNPSNVYGFASFKNKTLGRFKDLPIYNTSKLHY